VEMSAGGCVGSDALVAEHEDDGAIGAVQDREREMS